MATAKTAQDALALLWRDNFLKKTRSQEEVEKELTIRGYNFGDALPKALASAKYLLIQGEKKDRTYIQKYPFADEENR